MASVQTIPWFVDLNSELVQVLWARYRDKVTAFQEQEGLAPSDLYLAQLAAGARDDDERMINATDRTFSPYGSSAQIVANLRAATERGLLEPVEGGYRATGLGRAMARRLHGEIEDSLTPATAADEAASWAADILGSQVQRCQDCDFAVPHLEHSRRFDPGPGAPPLSRLRRAVFDLNSYRDDAHEAAFSTLNVPAHEWEAFSHIDGRYVWDKSVTTAAEVAEKLAFRGYDEGDYHEALESTMARGWLRREGVIYTVTPEGQRVREAVERDTDARYFNPWQLRADEAAELQAQLVFVHQTLLPAGEDG